MIEHRQTGTWEYVTDPTLVKLDAGDVVHNGVDTKKILRRCSASALAGQSFASGGSIPWDFSTVSNSSKASSKAARKTNWKNYIDKLFDWIEIRLDRLQAATDKWTQQIEKSIGYVAKNNAIDSTVGSISDQIKTLEEAAVRYQKQAADVAKKSGLSASAKNKVQNGTMDISLYGEDTQKKIKEYQTWKESSKGVSKIPRDMWSIVKDCHEATKSTEEHSKIKLFYSRLPSVSKRKPNTTLSFTGLIKCGICGRTMGTHIRARGKENIKPCWYRSPEGVKCKNRGGVIAELIYDVIESRIIVARDQLMQELPNEVSASVIDGMKQQIAAINSSISSKQKAFGKH